MIGQSWYLICDWSELVLSLWLVRVGTLFVVGQRWYFVVGQSWYFVIVELVLLCACLVLVVYDCRVGTLYVLIES